MNPTFKIQSTGTVSAHAKLFIVISLQEITYLIIDNESECIALGSYHFNTDVATDGIANVLKQMISDNQILQESFKKVSVVYAFSTAVLVPASWMIDRGRKDMLELLFGDQTDVFIRTDFLYEQNIHNIYAVPKQIDELASYLFPSVTSTHLYSILPSVNTVSQNNLYCIFGNNCVTAILFKEGKLQVIQTFIFKVPEDVTYYLLQICEAFEVAAQSVEIYLNGMIDSHSNLFIELNKYFLQMQFQTLPKTFTYPEEIREYPEHYFSHLFEIAQCV